MKYVIKEKGAPVATITNGKVRSSDIKMKRELEFILEIGGQIEYERGNELVTATSEGEFPYAEIESYLYDKGKKYTLERI